LITAVDAATDTTVAAWYRELDAEYPGSKFILTLRRLCDWLDSCAALWQAYLDGFDELATEVHRLLYGRIDFDRTTFTTAYIRHVDGVLSHFMGRDQDLLLIDICQGEGWERLCPFLGFDIVATAFPRSNARADLRNGWVTDVLPPATRAVLLHLRIRFRLVIHRGVENRNGARYNSRVARRSSLIFRAPMCRAGGGRVDGPRRYS